MVMSMSMLSYKQQIKILVPPAIFLAISAISNYIYQFLFKDMYVNADFYQPICTQEHKHWIIPTMIS